VTFAEIGDALPLLPAQAATGVGALDDITGSLTSTNDVDVFRIHIDDPAVFRAETFSPLDTQLFLFSVSGMGIAANDDLSISRDAGLPQGNAFYAALSAGDYLIAISPFDVDPLSQGDLIFPNLPKDSFQVVGASGPGSLGSVDSWTTSDLFSGNYRIRLTGVSHVPEPSTGLLLMTGLLGLAYRQRRQRHVPHRPYRGSRRDGDKR